MPDDAPLIHSVRLLVEKPRGAEPPVVAAEFTWRRPDLPSRHLFTPMLEGMYDLVELPYFRHHVEAEVALHDRVVVVEAGEPVAPPEEVGLELWSNMARAGEWKNF